MNIKSGYLLAFWADKFTTMIRQVFQFFACFFDVIKPWPQIGIIFNHFLNAILINSINNDKKNQFQKIGKNR